ncbi:MAG: hypothetical protein ACTSQP_14295 [Promethearchaeota archaeon]
MTDHFACHRLDDFYTYYALGGDLDRLYIPECHFTHEIEKPDHKRLYDIILVWKRFPNIDKDDYAYFYPCLIDIGSDISLIDPKVKLELDFIGENAPFKVIIGDIDGSRIPVKSHRLKVWSVGSNCKYQIGAEGIDKSPYKVEVKSHT